ncbi:MAG TPA: ROK family protein [Bryobacterales bacterium]|jgi:glucokinase|nr:ROK family protein [Bryobacterales bacterium]
MEQTGYAVGVDVGGTKVAAAVIDPRKVIHSKIRLSTEKQNRERSIAQVAEAARKAVEAARVSWENIAAVGVDVPGVYYPGSGEVWAPNLPGWDRIPLRGELQTQLPRPVVIDSDRSAYVLGEQWAGIARGLTDVVFIAVGTGIGAGILSGGRLCRGAGGVAGAIGWLAVDPNQKPLYRQTGCLEAEAAGPGVARRAAALAARVPSQMLEIAGGCLDNITAETVVEAARRNDAPARQVLEETARYLAMGVANVISMLNPQMIVLGGGLMQAGNLLLDPIRRETVRWAQPLAAREVRIELTQLGEDAGLLGAARLALGHDHVG